jgi:hypothetical protein
MTLFRLATKKIPPSSEKPRRSAGLLELAKRLEKMGSLAWLL